MQLARRQLANRKPAGRTLDQADLRHKQTQKATQPAEQDLQQTKDSVAIAEEAVTKAKDNEERALQKLNRLESLIAGPAPDTIPPPSPPN